MTKGISKFELFTAFGWRKAIEIRGVKFDVVNRIEHEDGSGHSFNVTGFVGAVERTVYCQTVD